MSNIPDEAPLGDISDECLQSYHGDCEGYSVYVVSGEMAVPLLPCYCECHSESEDEGDDLD